MFEDEEKRISRAKGNYDSLLLEAFIKLEEDTFESKKDAVKIYIYLSGLNALEAWGEFKEKYKQFILNKHSNK